MLGGWGHHVAALVAAKEGGWWVIDSELSRVVRAEEWIEWLTTQQASSTNPLVFFVSEAERFGPAPGKYNPVDLYGDEKGDLFNGYFRDLIRPAPEKAP